MAKKTNISENSRKAYAELKASGQIKTQEALIFAIMVSKNTPLTRRELAKMAYIEMGAACRTIYNLLNKAKLIEISHAGKCKITQRTVNSYKVIEAPIQGVND
jgi:DNA-binding transcriptional regulator YhcF (GntR family)